MNEKSRHTLVRNCSSAEPIQIRRRDFSSKPIYDNPREDTVWKKSTRPLFDCFIVFHSNNLKDPSPKTPYPHYIFDIQLFSHTLYTILIDLIWHWLKFAKGTLSRSHCEIPTICFSTHIHLTTERMSSTDADRLERWGDLLNIPRKFASKCVLL